MPHYQCNTDPRAGRCRSYLQSTVAIIVVSLSNSLNGQSDDVGIESDSTIIRAMGTARFAERSQLAFGTAGVIEHINVDEGDRVSEGELLAWLWDDMARAQLSEATTAASSESALKVALTDVESAQKEWDAVLRANAIQPGAYPVLRARQLSLQFSRAQEVAEQRREERKLATKAQQTAEAGLEALQLYAPFAGVIVRRSKQRGEGVTVAEPVLELVNDELMRADVFVDPESANKLVAGMRARIRAGSDSFRVRDSDGDAQQTRGMVDDDCVGCVGFIDLSVQPVRRVVRVWVEFPRPDWARDGTQVTVIIEESQRGE